MISTVTLKDRAGGTATMTYSTLSDVKVGDGVLARVVGTQGTMHAKVVGFGGQLDLKHSVTLQLIARRIK